MRQGIAEGRVPPKCTLEGVSEQIAQLQVADEGGLADSPFFAPFRERKTSSSDGDNLARLAGEAIIGCVTDALRRLGDFVVDEYVPQCRDSIGCASLPDGEAQYQACLRFHTDTEMSAREIHDTGISEVRRLWRAMGEVAAEAGFADEKSSCDNNNDDGDDESLAEALPETVSDLFGGGRPIRAFVAFLRTDDQFYHADSDSLLSSYRNLCQTIAPRLLSLFPLECMPRIPVSVEPTPAHIAECAPTAYYLGGDGGGKRPGTFYANCHDLRARPKYEAHSLALHEAIPGHHLQISCQLEAASLPSFRRFMEDRRYFEAPSRYPLGTAYVEGWALYCESPDMGTRLGCYSTPAERFGQLSMEMWRACRLVVDTGLHALGWTRTQAEHFMSAATGLSQTNITAEVRRYITWPGQACAYKCGELEIRRLRDGAARRLREDAGRPDEPGGRLTDADLKAFHLVVLQSGSLPLSVLDEHVSEWVDGEVGKFRGAAAPASALLASPATISVGDALPKIEVAVAPCHEELRDLATGKKFPPPRKVSIDELFGDRRGILFGVPGAFSPLCHRQHLPGYIRERQKLRELGVEEVVCFSVNDVWCMSAWGTVCGAQDAVTMVADPRGELTRALGMTCLRDDINKSMGRTCVRRFALLVENGRVALVHEEPDGVGTTCSIANKFVAVVREFLKT